MLVCFRKVENYLYFYILYKHNELLLDMFQTAKIIINGHNINKYSQTYNTNSTLTSQLIICLNKYIISKITKYCLLFDVIKKIKNLKSVYLLFMLQIIFFDILNTSL